MRSDYVETPDDAKLIKAAINGMLMALDPAFRLSRSEALPRPAGADARRFGGLGIEVTMEDGVVKVVSPIEDTPAVKAGIMSGDLITHLDKEQIQGLTLHERSRRCADR